jgi:ABC-2 family transporter
MYMRLWWKDARQFWPVWVFLALAATVTQGLLVHYGGPEAQNGILSTFAWCWTSFYAFAVGAAAFAAERETGTLRFLDILPASRPVVWAGKISFAFVSTLALAGILLLIAELGSEQWGMQWRGRGLANALPMAGLLLQALALGLFCSAMMGNALLAAVAAIGLTSISWYGLLTRLDQFYVDAYDTREYLTWHIGIVLTALVGSYIAFTWSRRSRLGLLGIRFQSPIALAWDDSTRANRATARTQPPVAPEALTPAPRPVPIPFAASTVTARPWSADQPRPRSWFTELRYLAWQTMREGRRTWCCLLSFGLILPMGYYLIMNLFLMPVGDLSIALPWNGLVALAAGVSVFGLENRARSYRFVVHHGARPGIVWLAKLAVWCFGLAIIWVPIIVVSPDVVSPDSDVISPRLRGELFRFAYYLPLGFAVSQLCGMVIPRGITAGLVALVVALALGVAQAALIQGGMMPVWGLVAMPVALLVVTWAWSGDWLLDRPAPGRYIRLGLILTGTFGVLLGGYAGLRAWSIPDPGPIAPPSTWAAAPLPPDRNAADLYREAARKLGDPDLYLEFDRRVGASRSNNMIRNSSRKREGLDLIRQATARPYCRFYQLERLTLLSQLDLPPMLGLARLVIDQARERMSHDDLAGAWDDIVVLLRMARHVSEGATMYEGPQALSIEMETLDLARDWTTAPGQTPERLRAAIAAYRDLPRLTPAAEVVRGDAILFERTIDLPTDDIKGLFLEIIVGPMNLAHGNIPIWASLYIDLITTPWERERSRRVNRQFASTLIRNASLEPWQQQLGPRLPIAHDLESTPLAKYLEANTGGCLAAEARNEVARRALVQVMAIRAWQLRHDGRLPDRLEELVPDDLPSLPVDPYSGRPFGYLSLRLAANQLSIGPPPASPETRFLYSVGPDGRDNRGVASAPNSNAFDIVFPIHPLASPRPAKPADRDPGAQGPQGGGPANAKEPAKPASDKPPIPPASRP